MALQKIFIGTKNDHKDTDGYLDTTILGKLPFLVFPDGLVDSLNVLTETLENKDAAADLYGKDGGDEVDVTKMCNIFSELFGLSSLYFVNENIGYLTTVPPAQTVDPEYFRNRLVYNRSRTYPATYGTEIRTESVLLGKELMDFDLPKPSSDFGDTITVKTIMLDGIKTSGLNNRIKKDIDGGSLYSKDSLLPMIEINTNTFDSWDPKTLPFYTLIQEANNTFRIEYVGPQDVTKYYIPLQ